VDVVLFVTRPVSENVIGVGAAVLPLAHAQHADISNSPTQPRVRIGLSTPLTRWDGGDDRSSKPVPSRASHFATVRTLTPAASAAWRCVQP